ncbi:DUF5958 family protein [Larkinella insperata]|uniref:DUF5958 family protein n=1 Tax=Larkinella insperata TaxID=332158 RepID=A0ABW3Q851_9BACT|nr:DUF5958 family protein [Larkinella insperata]
MSLEEEVMIVEFAQGIRSEGEIVRGFSQLMDDEKRKRVFKLLSLIDQVYPTDAEVEQASAHVSPNDERVLIVKRSLVKKGLRIHTGEDSLDNSYAILLNLFKTAYQRQVALGTETLKKWWHQDLSKREVVEAMLANYRSLVEEIYQHPSFRNEFASIAKLRLQDKLRDARPPKSTPAEPSTPPEKPQHYHFVTYDEMLSALANANPVRMDGKKEDFKNGYAASMLFQSLARALSKQYHLEQTETTRLINEIVDRHLKETYNSEPYW